MKKIIILTALLTLFFVGCNKKKVEKSSYTVGVDPNKIYPFGIKDGDNAKASGFEHDLLLEIAKRADLKIDIIDCSFLQIISGVTEGKLDIGIGLISITNERKKNLQFSEPYMKSQVVILGNKDNKLMNEEKIIYGLTKGTYFKHIIENKKNIEIVEDIDTEVVIQKLIAKEIDYAIVDKGIGHSHIEESPMLYEKELLSEDHIGVAFSKNLPECFINKINGVILEMKKDGYLDELKTKYKIDIK